MGQHKQLTRVGQLCPNTIYAWQVGLPTKSALRSDFSGQEGDLTGKLLQLIHHGIDRAFEQGDFRVHFLSVNQNLLAQIAHSDSCDNGTDFTKGLLESQVGLLVLAKLALQGADVLDSVLKDHVLVVQLFIDLGAQVVNVLALVLDLVGLLVQVVAQVVELLLGEGSGRLLGVVAIALFRSEPVADPEGALLLRRAAAIVGGAGLREGPG